MHGRVVGVHTQQRYARRAALFGDDTAGDDAAGDDTREQPLFATPSAWGALAPPHGNASLRRLQSSQDKGMAGRLNARVLHARGFKGKGVRVGIMDSGLPKTHPDIKVSAQSHRRCVCLTHTWNHLSGRAHWQHIFERTDWTDDGKEDDTIGHGTFVAGVIGGKNRDCSGLAPEAELHAYKVFNSKSHAYTAWFIDAFNFAMHRRIHILNLSVGGPDWADRPFVRCPRKRKQSRIRIVLDRPR
jgi:membrane-bound transcription factor site-1 protease